MARHGLWLGAALLAVISCDEAPPSMPLEDTQQQAGELVCAKNPDFEAHRDCDGAADNGCETNVYEDARHCGACGRACPSDRPVCIQARCCDPVDGCD